MTYNNINSLVIFPIIIFSDLKILFFYHHLSEMWMSITFINYL